MKTVNKAEKTLYALLITVFLCLFLVVSYISNADAAKVGATQWTKSGNTARAVFDNQPVQALGAQGAVQKVYSFKCSFAAPLSVPNGKYHKVYIPGLVLWGNAGAPSLPFKPVKLLVPYGQKIVGVKVIFGPKVNITGEYSIKPTQRPAPLSQKDRLKPAQPNPDIYNYDIVYPEVPCGDAFLQKKHGYTILLINLIPLEYYPKSKKIAYYKDMEIQVETVLMSQSAVNAQSQNVDIKPNPALQNEIRSIIDNPETLSTYPVNVQAVTATEQYKYIIITTNDLKNTAGTYTFTNLINSKIACGVTAKIFTVQNDIYPYYTGVDSQEKIRNFIKDCYSNHGTRYVLLGGDKSKIPPRLFYVRSWPGSDADVDTMPVDMYYGCLDGTFNGNGNNKYGEPNDGAGGGDIDLYAEVSVGRAPVATAGEVSNFVGKTLAYETCRNSYLTKVHMVGEYLGFGGTAEYATDSMEQIRLGSSADSYTTIGFENSQYAALFDTRTLYDSPGYDWNKSELINIMNSGVHIINHLGHANETYDMKLHTTDLPALTNTASFFVYSQGCLPGAFDTNECFAEKITTIKNGAFACVMNARYGWGTGESTDGPSQRYDREFWDAFLGEGIKNIGKMNQDSKEDNAYRINEDCMRWCYYELNLFGDPELSISTNVGPQIGIAGTTFTDINGNKDGRIDPGETIQVVVTLKAMNGDFYNVSATLECGDPYVTLEQTNASFGIITNGSQASNANNPYRFIVSPQCPAGHDISFRLTVTANNYSTINNIFTSVFKYWPFEITGNLMGSAIVVDLDNNGTIEVITSSQDGILYCLNTGAQLVWSYDLGPRFKWLSSTTIPVAYDINGDGKMEILVAAQRSTSGGAIYSKFCCIDNRGKLVWEKDDFISPCITPVVADLNKDGSPEIIVGGCVGTIGQIPLYNLYCMNKNGEVIKKLYADPASERAYIFTSPALADINADGKLEILFIELSYHAGAEKWTLYCLNKDFEAVWKYELPSPAGSCVTSAMAVADLDNNGTLETVFWAGKTLYCVDNKGVLKWRKGIDNYECYNSPAIADVNKDGSQEILIAVSKFFNDHNPKCNAKLCCLDKDGNVKWEYSVWGDTYTVSSPVVSDMAGDKDMKILIHLNDQYFYCLNQNGQLIWRHAADVPVYGKACSAVADLNGDDKLEVLFNSYNALFCVDKDGKSFVPGQSRHTTDHNPWPMFMHDPQHTGYYKRIHYPPSAVSVTPSTGLFKPNIWYTFTTKVSDFDGAKDMADSFFLINYRVNGLYCGYFRYNCVNNKLYLRDNSDSAWVGGFNPGQGQVIENSYVKLNCQNTRATFSGNDLVVQWKVMFKSAFCGVTPKYLYLYATDRAGVNSGWQKGGTIIVKW